MRDYYCPECKCWEPEECRCSALMLEHRVEDLEERILNLKADLETVIRFARRFATTVGTLRKERLRLRLLAESEPSTPGPMRWIPVEEIPHPDVGKEVWVLLRDKTVLRSQWGGSYWVETDNDGYLSGILQDDTPSTGERSITHWMEIWLPEELENSDG